MEQKKVLQDAETELEALFQQSQGLTKDDLATACGPLLEAHRRAKFRRGALIVLAGIVAVLAAYFSGMAKLHFDALSRMALVKILPWWDWRPLHHQRCLVSNPHFIPLPSFSKEDCVSCEAVDTVDRVADTTYQHLLDAYLQRSAPVVVVDAMDTWPSMRSSFGINNITQRYLLDEKLKNARPCALTSNIRAQSTSDLATLLTKMENPHLTKWFVHWLNCNNAAMKALRQFYQRPYFLAPSVAPANFNWVLMSTNYKAKFYKKLNLETGLILLHQMRGSTSFRFVPLSQCNGICSEIAGTLQEGEIMVFLNHLWDFEYMPGRNEENIAILTETAWDNIAVY